MFVLVKSASRLRVILLVTSGACRMMLVFWRLIGGSKLLRADWAIACRMLVLQTVEFNKDYHGARIDGFQCVTKMELYGIIDRTYQKEEDVIRRERKIVLPMTMNKFESEIHRQMEDIGKGQEFFELQQEVKRLSETQKFSNKLQLRAV